MGFNYDRLAKKDGEHSNWWTSYADLFMMLSIVFLLMYVAASLRSGAAGHQKQIQFEQITKENADLKEQLKVYNTLKDQQLQGSNEAEQETYAKLMDKLKLLQDEAKAEKADLERQAKENGEKAFALNQYQQVVRNIINANVLAKAQIQHRDQVIQTKDETLDEQEEIITNQEATIQSKERLIQQNQAKIDAMEDKLQQQIKKLRAEQKWGHYTRKEAEKRIAKLRQEAQSRIGELQAKSAQAQRELKQQLNQAQGAIAQKESELGSAQQRIAAEKARAEGEAARAAAAEAAKGRALANAEGLKRENSALQGDLEKAKALANARRDLAKRIEGAFRGAGIKADVNGQTGQVTLDFGEEYFDTGSAALKPGMQAKLDKFFPTYTTSLFKDPKTAEKIQNLEIIGFASSTYKGKYVNPTSLRPEDREAVAYNLKLSFSRANEIFKHIYGASVLSDQQKKQILPLIKVVGRGYLPDNTSASEIPTGMPEGEFCRKYDCKKAQRVIVKFNLKD